MVDRHVSQTLLAQLDRIPVWPYPRSVLAILGAGFFFAFFDIVTIGVALPVISKQFQVTVGQASWAITASLIGYILGSFLDSRLADHFGRRLSLLLSVAAFSGFAVALIWALTLLGIGFYASEVSITILGFIASFTIGFIIPVLYTITGESFPTGVRATGVSLSDGFGHLGGAFCGQIILGVQVVYGFQGAFICMAITGVITAVLVCFTRKTAGDPLE